MSARFRYLAANGREVEIGTTGELVLAFLSADLDDNTLLYDAEGGGWAPAKNHSVFLTLDDSREGPKTSFTLAESKPLDPKEALAKVLRDREELRTPERRVDGLRSVGHLAPARDESFGQPESSARDVDATWERSSAAIPELLEPSHSEPRDRAKSFVGAATAALAGMGTALILVVLVWDTIGPALATARAGAQEPPLSAVAQESAVVPPGISTGMSTAELQAFADMVTEMQKLRSEHRVSRVPNVWLEGVYFSRAIDYPEVRDFWESFLEYVRAMQATESEAYRRSFVSHLERQGIGTSALSMLLARAMRTFEADRARRDALYASMLEMGTTAVQLHDLLAAHEGEISFEPARAGVSRDPVVEAVAENAKLTAEMNDLLDRMFIAIERAQGERVVPRNELLLALEKSLIPSEAANR